MSYEPYRNQGGGGGGGGSQGYGSYNPYSSGGNPYEQQGNPYAQPLNQGNPYQQATTTQQSYSGPGAPPVGKDSNSRLALQHTDSQYSDQPSPQPGGGYEMQNVQPSDPNRLLNECRNIDQAMDDMSAQRNRLKELQKAYLRDTDSSQNSALYKETDNLTRTIMDQYRGLVNRARRLKSDPESGSPRNAPQIGKIDRRLKQDFHKFQEELAQYRKENQEQIARQYLIAKPDATEAEIQEAVENPNQQVFTQSLMQSDRRGEAQRTMQNVRSRHDAIQKIERDIAEIAQLFQDLNALVVQQEPAVQQIEQRGEEVAEHVTKGNVELGGAVVKAKAARRKKWWCLLICILIVLIGVGVGVGVHFSMH